MAGRWSVANRRTPHFYSTEGLMRKFLLACALMCAPITLTACATIPTGTAQIADQSKADEQLAIGVNLGYKAFRLAVETGVESGLIKGQLAAKIALLDNELFEAVTAVDTAYQTSNSQTLGIAVGRFNTLLAQGNALIPHRSQ